MSAFLNCRDGSMFLRRGEKAWRRRRFAVLHLSFQTVVFHFFLPLPELFFLRIADRISHRHSSGFRTWCTSVLLPRDSWHGSSCRPLCCRCCRRCRKSCPCRFPDWRTTLHLDWRRHVPPHRNFFRLCTYTLQCCVSAQYLPLQSPSAVRLSAVQ